MNKNNVIEFKKPGTEGRDLLSDLLRSGAQKLIQEAVEAELESFLADFSKAGLPNGHPYEGGFQPSYPDPICTKRSPCQFYEKRNPLDAILTLL